MAFQVKGSGPDVPRVAVYDFRSSTVKVIRSDARTAALTSGAGGYEISGLTWRSDDTKLILPLVTGRVSLMAETRATEPVWRVGPATQVSRGRPNGSAHHRFQVLGGGSRHLSIVEIVDGVPRVIAEHSGGLEANLRADSLSLSPYGDLLAYRIVAGRSLSRPSRGFLVRVDGTESSRLLGAPISDEIVWAPTQDKVLAVSGDSSATRGIYSWPVSR
jgi:hypothetical protein